jgi:hypothetical protein
VGVCELEGVQDIVLDLVGVCVPVPVCVRVRVAVAELDGVQEFVRVAVGVCVPVPV